MIDEQAIIAAWRDMKLTGKRRFHDEHADFLRLAQQCFALMWDGPTPKPWPPYMEIGAMKLPADFGLFAEVLHQARPRVLIESGSLSGGSAAIWARMFRRIIGDEFRIITVELKREHLHAAFIESDPNIVSLVGDVLSPEIIEQVRALVPDGWPTMVTLDSAHDGLHVCREIATYAPLVTPGQFLIVEDGYLGACWGGTVAPERCHAEVAAGNARAFDYWDCPLGAVEALLATSDDFEIDFEKNRFVTTQNPFGFLRRKGA